MASKLLSSEQMNFTRAGIVCLDVIKLILKDILNLHIKPRNLYRMIIKTNTNGVLNRHQLELCTKTPNPDYDTFDVSLLYRLIRTFGALRFPDLKPTQGRGIVLSQQHTEIGDDIERLRIFRNESFAHLHSSSIPDSTFRTQSQNLKIAIGRIQMFMTAQGLPVNYKKQLHDALKFQFDIDDMKKLKIELETLLTVMNKEKKVPKMRGCLSCLRCKGSEDLQRKFYRERGSTVRHALLMSNIEKQRGLLTKLKTELTNLGDLNTSEIDGSESVKDLLCCLLQKKLISNNNVIYLQHLFRRTGSKELNQKCIEYAEGMNALCFYEKHVGNTVPLLYPCKLSNR
ncbi:uncharacterized protein LOC130050443 isoform X1 [Ostrea edulis]|uniref:uncharacterized protein LOC130050443 isoform X1 n=1 Tax=Ostrea edulis TaxID=37623 RepID=UPI0024AF369C|nr:uncharacterized protein LOC130050443 isoform X1 [Ostrea edulis]XP_056006515.1 uncharacterized protein LOC130050443 isoform X1 [Ostrea edulis]XP_056006516.1 uncharacterized protein LOC130050443 isoform X1 [Ostrea edulis]